MEISLKSIIDSNVIITIYLVGLILGFYRTKWRFTIIQFYIFLYLSWYLASDCFTYDRGVQILFSGGPDEDKL